jgi:hypothetical protein
VIVPVPDGAVKLMIALVDVILDGAMVGADETVVKFTLVD